MNDLEEVFDSKNIENISMKILGMQNSLKLLENVADYEDRKLQLEGLKNRLEAISSPAIVQAFNTSNSGMSKFYMQVISWYLNYYKSIYSSVLYRFHMYMF